MDDNPKYKNMVIPRIHPQLIELFKESCSVMDISIQAGFETMLRHFFSCVLNEIERNPDCDPLVMDQIHEKVNELLPMPTQRARGGLVG